MTDRARTVTKKCRTPFSTAFVHVDYDSNGKLLGGAITHPHKASKTQVARAFDEFSKALDKCLRAIGEETR